MINDKINKQLVGSNAYVEFFSIYRIIQENIRTDTRVILFESNNLPEIINKKEKLSNTKYTHYFIEEKKIIEARTDWRLFI